MVRAAISKDDPEYDEEHYLRPTAWKALRLSNQNGNVDPGTFRLLISGGGFKEGAMLPRYPEGHIILACLQNPKGVRNEKELADVLNKAFQPKTTFYQRYASSCR